MSGSWLLIAIGVVVGCGGGDAARFDHVVHLEPESGMAASEWVVVGGEARRAWRIPVGDRVSMPARIPDAARLELSVAVEPGQAQQRRPATLLVSIESLDRGESASSRLLRTAIDPADHWQTLSVPIANRSGQDVSFHFSFEPDGGPAPRGALLGEVLLLAGDDRPRPPNVVLVTLDTTRADVASDHAIAPHLAALAETGITFENAWSPATTTSAAHASILTGLPVILHGTTSNHSQLADEHRTLAEALRGLGLQTAASVSVDHLGVGVGFGQGFDRFRPAVPGDGQDGRHALEPALEWLSQWEREGSRPFFLWIHLFDPHTPYWPPGSFLEGEWAERGFIIPSPDIDPPSFPVFRGDPPVPLDWLAGVTNREYIDAMYRAGVGYADHLVGRLLAALDASGERERTIIVVTSDHGEALGEQDVWYQHAGLFPASLRVPLIASLPGAPRGVRSAARVTTIDILPSILRAITGRTATLPGRDLLDSQLDPDPSRRVWFAEAGLDQLGFRDGDVHFAHALRSGQFGIRVDRRGGVPRVAGIRTYHPGASWLFDANADPELTRNLARDPGAGTARYRELVRARAARRALGVQPRTLSAEEQARLRALGYLPETR
ncbi:MAG: sulfatase [Deltaproteobacteria bacterium]|nr:sulfatase [Deltaproteobacteria bacterium]